MHMFSCKFKIGDSVSIDKGGITGIIDSIRFHALGVVYSVEWFHCGTQHTGQFHEWRLLPLVQSDISPPIPAQSGGTAQTPDEALEAMSRCDYWNGRRSLSEVNYATFHSFKESGKWYATGRAVLDPRFFKEFPVGGRRKFLRSLMPDGKYPGLSTGGEGYVLVIVPDEDHENGFPIMLNTPSGRS